MCLRKMLTSGTGGYLTPHLGNPRVSESGLSRRSHSEKPGTADTAAATGWILSQAPLGKINQRPTRTFTSRRKLCDTCSFPSISSQEHLAICNTRHAVMVSGHKVGTSGRGRDTPTHHTPEREGPPGAPGPRSAAGGCGSWTWPGCAAGAGSSGTRRPTWRKLLVPEPPTGQVSKREDIPLRLDLRGKR